MGGEEGGSGALLSGRRWREFCAVLERAGEAVVREAPELSPLDRAEGYRYLTRLLRLALEKYVEHADPAHPRFYRLSHETAKIGCDNPDSLYQNACISGRYEYRLWGRRGSVTYLGFGTYYGDYGFPGRSGCSGYLEADQLELGPDGRFEILLSTRPQKGNWLPMEPDTSMLIVRQNFLDREREEPAELHLERIGAQDPPAPLDPDWLAGALERAVNYVVGTAELFARWTRGFAERPNRLLAMDPAATSGAHGDPNIFFYMGYWELGDDEALVIDLEPPPCAYWNFQLNNRWMESLDYLHHRIHLNRQTAQARPDGSVRIVVAHRDPHHPNWIETAGHRCGTMGLRWVKAEHHPAPRTKVVKLAELTTE